MARATAAQRARQRARAKVAAEAERVRESGDPAPPAHHDTLDWWLICRVAAACFLVGAALIHVLWMAIHLEDWALAGASFLVMALLQSALAFAVVALPSRSTYLLTIGTSLGIVALWALSRTVGLPIGPEAGLRESVGAPDLMAALFELLTALALLPFVVADGDVRPSRRAQSGGATTYVFVAALSLYTLVLVAVALVPAVAGHDSEPPEGAADHSDHTPEGP